MKKVWLLFIVLILMSSFAYATQPTLQTNKLYLTPFYTASMTQNVQYTFNVSTITPDGISQIKSAIVTLDAWISPTRTASIKVNGVACNTPSYTISTTYGSAGRGVFTFDCSNAILPMSNNVVNFTITGGNIGASTAWLDLTYMNNPDADISVFGTEYIAGAEAKIWLQLLNNTGGYVLNGVCFADVYSPDNEEYLERIQMQNMNHDGIYYYDLTAPLIEGVYPVIAQCYYTATTVQYYPNGNYSMTTGTATEVSPLSNVQTIDGSKWRFKEANLGGVRRLNFTLDIGPANSCTNVPENLLTGISITSYAKFDSVVNDNINFQIYNFTSGSWITLPNQHLEGNVWRITSNSLSLKNVTSAGLYNSTIGGFRLRITDSNIADGGDDDFDIDQLYVGCDQLSNPQWQEVKGASEIHINPNVDVLYPDYFIYTLCGNENIESLDGSCSQFKFGNYSGFTEPQGWLYENITVINLRQKDVDNHFHYETPMGVDCSAFLDILEERNGVTTDIYDNVLFSAGSLGDNCILTIPVDFNSSENSVNIVLIMDNYMLWEGNRANRLINFYRNTVSSYCNQLADMTEVNMSLPILTNLSEYEANVFVTGCWQTLDDLYWFDDYYNLGLGVNTSGDYSSALAGIRFYYPEIIKHFNTVELLKSNPMFLYDVQTICEKESGINLEGNDVSCQLLMPSDEYFSSQEGWILGNLTFTNIFESDIHSSFLFETGKDVDCSAILDVIKVDEWGNEEDIFNQTTFRAGDSNCILNIPIVFEANQTKFDVLVKQENYVHWNMIQMKDKINSIRNNTETFCEDLLLENNVSYYLPINASIDYITNPDARYCLRALDDLYWFDFFDEAHEEVHNDTHYLWQMLTYYDEFLYYYPFIMESDSVIRAYQRGEVQDLTLSLLQNMNFSSIMNYLNDINSTLTTIDGRLISIENLSNSINNRFILLNGTIYDMYSLMIQMNQTITQINAYADSINATIIDIQSTLNGVEQVVLDINGTISTINLNLIEVNNTLSDVYIDTQEIKQIVTDINTTSNNIYTMTISLNETLDSIQSSVSTIDGKVDVINMTTSRIEDALFVVNGTVNNIGASVVEINGTINQISNDLISINGSITQARADILYDLGQINASLSQGQINTINHILSLNTTLSDKCDSILSAISGINNSDVIALLQDMNISMYSNYIDLKDAIVSVNGSVISVQGTVNDIENVVLQINGTVSEIKTISTNIYDLNIFMNDTINTIKDSVVIIDGKVDVINQTTSNIEDIVLTINGTVNNIDETMIEISGNVSQISNDLLSINGSLSQGQADLMYSLGQINISLSQGQIDIINNILSVNSSLAQQHQDILAAISGINNSDVTTILNEMNTTISNNHLDVMSAIVSVNDSVILVQGTVNGIENVVLQINGTVNSIETKIDIVDGKIDQLSSDIFQLNNTANSIFNATTNIQGTLIDINGSINNIDNTLLDMSGNITNIDLNVNALTLSLNTSNQQILNAINDSNEELYNFLVSMNGSMNTSFAEVLYQISLINTSNQDVLDAIALINTSNQDVLDFLLTINTSNQDVLDAIALINNTDVLDAIALLNTSNQDVLDYLVILNTAIDGNFSSVLYDISQINTSNQDVLDAIAMINTSNDDVLYALSQMNLSNQDVLDAIALINTSNQDVLDAIALINTSNEDVLISISQLNTSNQDVLNYLTALEMSIDGNFTNLFDDLDAINTSNQDVLDALALINTSNQDVLDAITLINTSNDDVLNFLTILDSNIEGNFSNVIYDISQINTSNQDVLDFLLTINTSNQDVIDAIGLINTSNQDVVDLINILDSNLDANFTDIFNEFSQINTSNQDVLDAMSLLNMSNQDVLDSLSDLNANMGSNFSSVIYDISQINTSNQDVLDFLLTINTSNQDVIDAIALINTSNQDVLDVVALINTSNQDVLDSLSYTNTLINNTYQDTIDRIDNLESTLLVYLENINNTQCNCSEIISYLQNIGNDTTNIIDLMNLMNGSQSTQLQNIYDLLEIVNSTQYDYSQQLADLYSVSLEINNTQYNYTQNLDDIYSLLVNMNGTIYLLEGDINGIEVSLSGMNSTIISTKNSVDIIEGNVLIINNTVNSLNTTISSIENAVISINSTTNDIYSGLITINGTINGIENSIITINGTINSVESKVDIIDDKADIIINSLVQMNATINNIEAGVMNITIPLVNLTFLENSVSNIEGMVLNINNSVDYFNNSITNMTNTLNDVHTLVFTINETTFEIHNLSVSIDEKIDSLTNLSLLINGTVYSYLSEFAIIREMIQNQTDYLEIALADISYFGNTTNASDYYDNLSIDTPSILETQMFQVGIDTLRQPLEGDFYNLNYYYFNRNTGSLVKEFQTSIKGEDEFQLSMSSEGLEPINKAEQMYDVWVRVEMLNGRGLWQSFPIDYVGELKVVNLNDNGARGSGPYDVIVSTEYGVVDTQESVSAEITIKNTGDTPDEDTILTYWLEDSGGNKYSTTKEQFLEVPVGTMTITRSLPLPLGAAPGEYKFVADYETVVQPKIGVFDAFVVADMTWIEKQQQRFPQYFKKNMLVSIIGFLIFMILLIVLIVTLTIREKERHRKDFSNKRKDFNYRDESNRNGKV